MEMNREPCPSPARPSASVVMLRDGSAGLEVFLIKRHSGSEVLGGVHVFPGGKVDHQDALVDPVAHLDLPASSLHAALDEDHLDKQQAAALHVAALREAFEETGVLYAQAGGTPEAARARRLMCEGHAFGEVLALMSLRLEVSRLQPWSRWITPAVGGASRKRFDTRFFLAPTPSDQVPRHDDHEAIDSVWLTPRAALGQYWARDIELAPPQIMSLAHLARHRSVAAALTEARQRKPPLVLPEPFEQDGARIICYPGDERHSVRERAWPGPTRLLYRNRRFEPAGGFEALFASASLELPEPAYTQSSSRLAPP